MRARVHARVPALHGQQIALASAVLAAVVVATPTAAAGPSVQLGPPGPLPSGTHTLTVTGTGFDPAGNHGNGIYVVFGPITPAPGYYMDPSVYGPGLKWVHPGAQESGAEAPLAADGTFVTTIDIMSPFDNASGAVDCAVVACAVITFGAHGSQDRSQDTCTYVPFSGDDTAGASMSPVTGASPSGQLAEPAVTVAPSGSAASASPVTPTDPCSLIGATP